jgi:hypothetical protein
VHALWLQDIESLEAISQDEETCALCLRMAEMSRLGRLTPFLYEVERDGDLDAETKATLTELASEPAFLHAVEEYVHRTSALH